jgi:hypothetical protein
LNAGRDTLEDILVLHLENGPDYFINASGEYARSCFGATLEELVCALEPIRNVPFTFSPEGNKHFSSPQSAPSLSVPKVYTEISLSLVFVWVFTLLVSTINM